MQYLDAISKWQNDFCSFPRQTRSISQYSKSISQPVMLKQLKLNGSMKTQDLLEVTPPKHVLFIIGDWNVKAGSQEIPGVTGKFGLGVQNEAGQRLIEFCQENALVIANTFLQQHKRNLYTWTSPDGQHWNQIDYILCSQRWRSSIQSAKQYQEVTVAQVMNSLLPFILAPKNKNTQV